MLAREACDRAGVDALASIELRGALLLSAISSYTGRPCFVIRKTAKFYGVTGRIVGGDIVSGQRFILFDDVVTDGQSKMDSIMTLEEVGAKVNSVFVVVDREQGGKENLSRKGYNLDSIFTVSQLTEELSHQGLIDENTRGLVTRYLKSERDVINHSTA